MEAQHSPSSHGPCTVNRRGQALPEYYSELSEFHLYSKSVRSLSVSYRNSPRKQISPEGSYFCDYLLLPASLCLEMLSTLLLVSKSKSPRSAVSPDSPFHSIHDTLRSNTVCYSMALFFTYTLCMVIWMTMPFSPLSFFPFLFNFLKVFPGLISFPADFFPCSLFPAVYFIFITAFSGEFEGFLPSVAVGTILWWYFW